MLYELLGMQGVMLHAGLELTWIPPRELLCVLGSSLAADLIDLSDYTAIALKH